MYGRELLGRTLQDGRIQYTDWGNLSVELHMAFRRVEGPFYLRTKYVREGLTLDEFLHNEIQRDTKGICTLSAYLLLPDADCVWLLKDGFLFDPERNRTLGGSA